MISIGELAGLRATQETALPDEAVIVRRAYASDGAGGQTETITTVTARCRAAPASAHDVQRAGALSEKPTWRITFAAGTDLRDTDRIDVGARNFEIVTLLAGGSWETARVALCAER